MSAPAQKYARGQADHVDAWLISYADLITLLFMFFVILISMSTSLHDQASALTRGEARQPSFQERFGFVKLKTRHDGVYRQLLGIVAETSSDRQIAVEQTARGISIDIAALWLFAPGKAELPPEGMPLLKQLAEALKEGMQEGDMIEVTGYTDDAPLEGGPYANNWELAGMRATRIVTLLIAEGVDPSRLRAVSHAGNRPVVPNRDGLGQPIAENRERNQRVVITLENNAPRSAAML